MFLLDCAVRTTLGIGYAGENNAGIEFDTESILLKDSCSVTFKNVFYVFGGEDFGARVPTPVYQLGDKNFDRKTLGFPFPKGACTNFRLRTSQENLR